MRFMAFARPRACRDACVAALVWDLDGVTYRLEPSTLDPNGKSSGLKVVVLRVHCWCTLTTSCCVGR